MNILIDTNILIPLEDTSRTLDPSLAEMRRLSEQNGHVLFAHPSQREDIQRDRDEGRRAIVLSRLNQYQLIPSPPPLSNEALEQYGWRQTSENDRIDNLLLHALCRGAVHFLITNDKDLHKKARTAHVQEQVHLLDQFLAFLKSQSSVEKPPPFGIQERYLHQFDVAQSFFDSLRDGYNGFDEWYWRSARNHRKAWCVSEGETLHAICIYKEEDHPVIVDRGIPLDGSALKLCTFKVGERVRGRKLGERLLFSAFKYAVEHGIPYVYLHTYGQEHEMLVSLCQNYGFELAGKYADRDDVYIKRMSAPVSVPEGVPALAYAVTYYPNYLDSEAVGKFIVPIQPQYHNDLFADTSDMTRDLFVDDWSFYNPQSNTIKKAYICHATTNQIQAGDLLFFYRTHDRKSIECMGVVEQTYRGREVDKVLPLVSKRTVYSRDEIEAWLQSDTLVILFRFIRAFSPISRSVLIEAGINGQIQSIRKISHEQYLRCFSRSPI
jgi:GNAT superfamily N-acetyltransferase